MPRVTFSLEDLQREISVFSRKNAQAKQRLVDWQDEEPQHAQREVVLIRGKARLFHYLPRTPVPRQTPLLIVYSLVNRPYMVDLAPESSLIEALLDEGLEVYLIDWGYPDREDRWRTLGDYIARDLDACVETIRTRHQIEQVNLLGICQGGTFCLCYCALQGDKVKNLILTVTPVDFQTPGDLLSHLLRGIDVAALVAAYGNISGDFLNAIFIAQKPLKFTHQKYVDFVEHADDDAASGLFLAMEKWIFDSPSLAGEAFREFAQGCYQSNGLVNGTLQVGTQNIRLQNLQMPVLNLFARDDHLVPPAAARALGGLIGSTDYTEVELAGGHIGIYVNAKTRAQLVATVMGWLSAREGPVTQKTGARSKRLP